jgi:ClpP class serine protease
MRISDAIDSVAWAMEEEWVQRLRSIALGEGEGPEAVAARLGRPLQNAQDVRVRDGVAVIPIVGPIFRYANLFTQMSGATSIEIFARDLRAALDDPQVKAILLEINSPGGQADGINEAANMIAAADKPLIAYVSGLGASGAYWLAAAAQEIVIDATAQLGSIGVVMAVPQKGDPTIVEFVSSQSPAKRPDVSTPEGRAQHQMRVDALAQVFIESIARFRGVSPDAVLSRFGAGGVKVGAQAVAAGMADRAGSLETTLAQLAGGYEPKRRKNQRPKQGANAMTDEEAKALADKARTEGHAAGIEEGKSTVEEARKAGRDDGTKAERERLLGIDKATMPGHETLAAEAKTSGMSAADFALRQVEAEKLTRERRLEAIRKDGTAIVIPPAPSATGEHRAAAIDPSLSLEDRCKAKWNADEKIRSEFVDLPSYLAFEKASSGGKIKFLGKHVA